MGGFAHSRSAFPSPDPNGRQASGQLEILPALRVKDRPRMRHAYALLCLAALASAQSTSSPEGTWVSNLKLAEDNNYGRMELNLNGTKLTGKFGDNSFEGVFQNGRIEGTVKLNQGPTFHLQGSVEGDRIEEQGHPCREQAGIQMGGAKGTTQERGRAEDPHLRAHRVSPLLLRSHRSGSAREPRR